ncbi:gamma-glutamyl-gamma-aminobutyrate hydrolase family protein [Lentibacillus saliphilus]|uniref:gamma-glutamyl-gamma-aminobutyrate hydrolase family protein n=1 Tax=Lentibacillus saliphilus TaxID=2737028 RepID=UPI001C30F3EC|nr:gamma-glutamyl-gamma-aminobutyrate hydrolase family protein [Lentibacillus saliphilus]
MKPIIGITPSMEVDELYYKVANANADAILKSGGLPVIVPYNLDEADMDQLVTQLDGLYLTGGYDIDPTLFNEEPHPNLGTIIPSRDLFEQAFVNKMLEVDKPILAVCRGIQILNIAMGGDMYQDIYTQVDRDLLQHSQNAPLGHGSHFVDVSPGSLLHQLTGRDRVRVNSRHHQANRSVKQPLKTSGTASDLIIEAVESETHRFVLGVQWHPENMLANGDEPSERIYRGFINACSE